MYVAAIAFAILIANASSCAVWSVRSSGFWNFFGVILNVCGVKLSAGNLKVNVERGKSSFDYGKSSNVGETLNAGVWSLSAAAF